MHTVHCGPYYALDLAITHDTGCRIQQQFYINAILQSDRILFGAKGPLGTERRPGLLIIGRLRWERFLESVQNAVTNQQKVATWCWEIFRLLGAVQRECILWERNPLGYVHAWRATDSLQQLMVYNVLFNVFPVSVLRERLLSLLGEEVAATALQWASYPFTMSHYTKLELARLSLALSVLRKGVANTSRFINDNAFAFTFYIDKNPLEDPETLQTEVSHLIELGEPELRQRRDSIVAQIRSARNHAREALGYVYRAQAGAPDCGAFHLLYLWRALATQEEERHWLQLRVQRNFRLVLEAYGMDLHATSQEEVWSLLRKEAACGRHFGRGIAARA